MQKWLDDGGATTDLEYTRQQARLNTEIDRYNSLKRDADNAVSRDKSLRDSLTESEEILKQFENEVGVGSSPINIPDNIKKAISIIRKNNPDATSTMSDEDIIEYLIRKGKIR